MDGFSDRSRGVVFAMAFALIGLDIVLRAIVIEKRVADLYADLEPQEPVPPTNTVAAEPTDPEDMASKSCASRLPPILTLLANPRLLNALWASLMQAVLTTAFETTVKNPPLSANHACVWPSTAMNINAMISTGPALRA